MGGQRPFRASALAPAEPAGVRSDSPLSSEYAAVRAPNILAVAEWDGRREVITPALGVGAPVLSPAGQLWTASWRRRKPYQTTLPAWCPASALLPSTKEDLRAERTGWRAMMPRRASRRAMACNETPCNP
jgi:hypothetical protein